MAFVRRLFPNGDARNGDGLFRGVPLRREAAGALDALNYYYREEFGKDIPIEEGFRSLERQEYYYDRYINRRAGWTVAAIPGTSNHGWAEAADLGAPLHQSSSREHAWLRAQAPLFGWWWEGAGFGEPWHWLYDARNVTEEQRTDYLRRGAGNTEPVRTLTVADIDTGRVVRIAGHGTRCWLLHSGGVLECATDDQVEVAFVVTGQSRDSIPVVSRVEFDAWASHIHWQTTAGVFQVLDRHEAVLHAIERKVTA